MDTTDTKIPADSTSASGAGRSSDEPAPSLRTTLARISTQQAAAYAHGTRNLRAAAHPPPPAGRTPLRRAVRACDTLAMADTADLAALPDFPFQCALLAPARALAGLASEAAAYHAWVAVRRTLAHERLRGATLESMSLYATEIYLVELGAALAEAVDGPVCIAIDPRRHRDTGRMVSQGRRLAGRLREKGVRQEHIVVGIPATFAGIAAAEELRRGAPPVQVNLLLVSSFPHARLCAEAQADAMTFSCSTMNEESRRLLPPRTQMPRTPHWLRDIETTAAYVRRHGCKTLCAVADLCGPTTPLPAGVGCVALADANIKQVQGTGELYIRTTPHATSGPRAEAAPYRTRSVTKEAWDEAMATDTAAVPAAKILERGLREMAGAMDELQRRMHRQVTEQLDAQRLDLAGIAALYEKDMQVLRRRIQGEKTSKQLAEEALAQRRRTHLGFRLLQREMNAGTWKSATAMAVPEEDPFEAAAKAKHRMDPSATKELIAAIKDLLEGSGNKGRRTPRVRPSKA